MPTLIIMRGVSGSGKSTKAKQLRGNGEIFSTDDFFMHGNRYIYDAAQIKNAHKWNQMRAEQAMMMGVDPVVIDNTTVKAWEAKPYVEAALRNGYDVKIVEPDSPWWRKFRPNMSNVELQLFSQFLANKNQHGVPPEVIYNMLSRWQHNITINDIMSSPSF